MWCAAGQRTTRLRPPTPRLAVVQVVLATLRTILTASVLAALLAPAGVPYLEVVGVFVFAVGVFAPVTLCNFRKRFAATSHRASYFDLKKSAR